MQALACVWNSMVMVTRCQLTIIATSATIATETITTRQEVTTSVNAITIDVIAIIVITILTTMIIGIIMDTEITTGNIDTTDTETATFITIDNTKSLNDLLAQSFGGFKPNRLIVMSGRSNVGKSKIHAI